ncbi:glycosyltransferase family 2 protein [Arcanobacterium pinnipediorum]|uniref:Glycosyltransferase family 2 protein n=1 Tax=Arcanobacterium pinnipediorum TaxID=1503041 RepID=A0ABY5AHA1_9ACTO|nr:glycosyltransferase family 2 protein [Arcanobacterium pinnipediorum]USR79462.1 glycosyltransferase family 2 protein [Arcanobacterium pinnipediorum]
MAKERILIIIPAWNEQDSIAHVIESVHRELPTADCVVVNDGSRDATVEIAKAAGASVLDLPINLGVGGAMRTGFHYALRNNYTYAVQVDADGQHDPAYIHTMLKEARNGADVVIGARFAGVGHYTAHGPRWWAMVVLSRIMSRLAHTKLTDVTSGFKIYSRKALQLYVDNYPAEYLGDTIEALVIGIKSGLTITQVGVEMRQRTAGIPSHSPFKAAIYLFRAGLALAIALMSRSKKA